MQKDTLFALRDGTPTGVPFPCGDGFLPSNFGTPKQRPAAGPAPTPLISLNRPRRLTAPRCLPPIFPGTTNQQ